MFDLPATAKGAWPEEKVVREGSIDPEKRIKMRRPSISE
jgi:hypothetical protein